MTGRQTKASVAQFFVSDDTEKNLGIIVSLIERAASSGSKIVFFPEYSDYLSDRIGRDDVSQTVEEGWFISGVKKAAVENDIWVDVYFHETNPSSKYPYNTSVLINSEGQVVTTYRKLHMFIADVADGPQIDEGAMVTRGSTVTPPVDSPIGKLGLAICHDLRFPELASAMREMGAQSIAYCAAFSVMTGIPQWEALLRARAIETQTYVFGAGQIGAHGPNRAFFGNSLIVDPWGNVIARCNTTNEPTIATADIDLDYINVCRKQVSITTSKRYDVFNLKENDFVPK
ncbi:hypothetical protein BB560_003928 [Smittium megazygosporum]|uniref:CN hydrolase domain-containing protein n=1 Tax=Smittium megazygosporum TaxID=133381 RepID=A0A2T9ZAN5_9FUNG|nr:hypothetical protein BB560_003928 [Smittium megazygosporum]